MPSASLLIESGFPAWVDRCRQHVRADWDHTGRAAAALARLVAAVPCHLSPHEQCIARALLDEGWSRLMAAAVPAAESDNQPFTDARVARAIAEIDRRFADPTFHLRTLARQLAISDSRLTQLLKHSTGQTFGRRLHARRVHEAELLLSGSAFSVKEIASRVGYATTSQLGRHFRRILNRRPSEIRGDMSGARGTRATPTQSLTQHQK